MKFFKRIAAILLIGIVILMYAQIPIHTSAALGTKGTIDAPTNGSSVKGQVVLRGWFLDENGVAKLEVLVDGTVAGQAIYGDARPDVQNAFPEYNNGKAGYHFTLDTAKWSDGKHTVTVRETSTNGLVTTLPEISITFANVNVQGYVDNPVSGSTLKGTQNVSGWFLDESGVSSIDVLVDGTAVGQATYGDARADVQKAYPEFNNGNAGYHYALDTTKLSDGKHTVTIKETGKNGHVTTMPGISVTIANVNVQGYVESPSSGSTLKGIKTVSGWFLDESGVSSIDVLVDGTAVGQATYGDARADVQKAYPEFNNGNAGYHYALDTTKLSDGKHTITIKETGKNGHVTTMPGISVTIANVHVQGYIESPSPGSTLKGIKNVSGWFLDESGVSSIDVLVDGTAVGQATYGDARGDVQKAYPEFNNGNAGFHYALDTTKLSDGQHTVTIRETGKNGHVTTLSEIPVTIANVHVAGYVDNPVPGSTFRGTKNISGWFLDDSGVSNIDILIDGAVIGQATYGDARADVQKAYPEFNNGNSGFHYTLDTTKLSDGQHKVTIRETGANGRITTSSDIPVIISNAIGYVDSPVSGSVLKGTKNISGWFLDMNGVSSIDILVDGAVVGQAAYGDARTDVQKSYPEFNNGNSGFHYTLDTTQFSDGQHIVTIRETGTNGNVTTMAGIPVIIRQTNYSVFLDPGHGGTDPGATAGSYKEKDLNLAVAKKVQSLLAGRGYTVYMSRTDDTFIPLLDRSQKANDLHADIFVSIHTNALGTGDTTASGIESYYYQADPSHPSTINGSMATDPNRISKSKTLANIIQDKMVAYTGAYDRGSKGSDLSVVRESAMPATLLEMGFINNSSERQKLLTDSYQNTLAKAIADGIDEYFRML